jgi:hypothetical protein
MNAGLCGVRAVHVLAERGPDIIGVEIRINDRRRVCRRQCRQRLRANDRIGIRD